jgi:hypothetical protein
MRSRSIGFLGLDRQGKSLQIKEEKDMDCSPSA